eukprot:CAMPEP_0119310580 /NCGR_PEP_ID=MMETSP1333-20130426/19652_1 /TAXON_ID=418940 /ORGANISM="Scyphosphaera apsteinii, Strain RCC1455" /LENGTH=136 /DNA_ID=CAMNT_0007314795 /DNA_START=568 /DNA_END=978 /DNA_ORIENTATION=-
MTSVDEAVVQDRRREVGRIFAVEKLCKSHVSPRLLVPIPTTPHLSNAMMRKEFVNAVRHTPRIDVKGRMVQISVLSRTSVDPPQDRCRHQVSPATPGANGEAVPYGSIKYLSDILEQAFKLLWHLPHPKCRVLFER